MNASPIGDLTAFFIALNASVELGKGGESGENGKSGKNGKSRKILLKDLYKGYKELDKQGDEIISKISFDVPPENAHFNFEKVSKRIHLDIASVNSAAQIAVTGNVVDQAHISAGGVGPIPTYLKTRVSSCKEKN